MYACVHIHVESLFVLPIISRGNKKKDSNSAPEPPEDGGGPGPQPLQVPPWEYHMNDSKWFD